MAYTIAFFGTKPYDEASFNEKNKEFGFELRFFKGHLNRHNVLLTQGVDTVCIFVNDTADAEVIRTMAANGVKLLALRCAGYNNVDLKAAADNGVTVVRVPAYSPYAVAEYTVALMLSLNRKIPRASWRTRDGNFSLHGLLGFDMHGKTAGIIGTGKIAKILIHILKGFGMNILAYDLYPDYNEKWTQPPKPYTEATLLRAMETAGKLVDNDELRDALKENGIGRPSTRAAIIETLFKRNYIRKEKKNLIATPTGVELIQLIHEELLKSAELTGIWEKKLREIEKKTYDARQFLEDDFSNSS